MLQQTGTADCARVSWHVASISCMHLVPMQSWTDCIARWEVSARDAPRGGRGVLGGSRAAAKQRRVFLQKKIGGFGVLFLQSIDERNSAV